MELEIIAYALTALIGLVSGIFSSHYRKFKDILSGLDKSLEDDRITKKEIQELLKILKRS